MLVIEELLERADPAFVAELRDFDDADRLASFAAKWYADRRPPARKLLFDYLDLPLNAYRHEPLVKRLFKLAEAAGDDAVMARFLVLFDRSIRRTRRRNYHYEHESLNSEASARALVEKWHQDGAEFAGITEWGGRYHVTGRWAIERLCVPRDTTMPRGTTRHAVNPRTGRRLSGTDLMSRLGMHGRPPKSLVNLPERLRRKLEGCQLFTVHTRHYLRRRAWRYFRMLGKDQPQRYVPAVIEALKLYKDADVSDGLALIDNWGLTHVLFHHSPVLLAKNNGWTLAEGRSLSQLAPAPRFESLWSQAPRALIDLVRDGRSRTVRQWALHFLRREGGSALAALPVEELLSLLLHQDAEVAAVAAEALRKVVDLNVVSLQRWLALLDGANAASLDVVCELMLKHLQPDKITLEQAVELAGRRPVPVARLGFSWLQSKSLTAMESCKQVLTLTEAQAATVRGEIARWLRQVLGSSAYFQPEWVLELLDCRHENVRREGWSWLQEEPRARHHVELWRRLLESPYDDVRLQLVADLEGRVAGLAGSLSQHVVLDPEMVRFLWASVLLNIHRGNRHKPLVIAQIVRRLQQCPGDAPSLFPILSVALRSIRGPEWRVGLAGVVRLLEQNPGLEPLARDMFPELSCAV
jgi:hypothetical protein